MGMGGGSGGGLVSEINVTPMVDIMLVLLIIFMVVTPLLQEGVPINLPAELVNPVPDERIIREDAIVISIPRDNEYYLGKNRTLTIRGTASAKDNKLCVVTDPSTNCSELQRGVDTLLKNIKEDKDKIVFIKSGIGVQYGQVVDIIKQVRELKVDKIGLVADKKKGAEAAP